MTDLEELQRALEGRGFTVTAEDIDISVVPVQFLAESHSCCCSQALSQ